jgi:beta-N-acetylhexosaminidase
MREGEVVAVPKHFPGHEDTPADSHTELPVLTVKADAFDVYVQNFTDTISNAAPLALMTAHVQVPSIDSTYPPPSRTPS